MLRLRTFGGLSLSRGEENLTGAASQRRRLAILVLLAAAGETGMSRDKLVAYLWPESDAERARHVLNQLLYAQRRQVDDETLFIGRKTLRLNPAAIDTDVGNFQEALRRGVLHAAVAIYTGPFLDGFFLKDASEFEQWVSGRRDHYLRSCLHALTTLAENAGASGDSRTAITWWRRSTELDPLDSTVALGLVQALRATGDRPGALRHARLHASVLRMQLGVAPDPRMLAVVAELGG